MNQRLTLALIFVTAALAGCTNLSSDQRFATGGLVGGAAGLVAANELELGRTGRVAGTLLGAAAGSSIAAGGGRY